ncbi:involucrin-like isoform X5 [Phycodurus eques]|uniref:involucrin-like isoform X5 n=1 Tax=Phycodurus eques TaxID=693459 RepID=UPI002ACD2189|nr:involucrin-like isoform X5 [Phycodurus eques]
MFDFCWKEDLWCIDASVYDGSLGRLVNADYKHPNCQMKRVIAKDKPHLCLFALRDIQPGEEITCDLGGKAGPQTKQDLDEPEVLSLDKVGIIPPPHLVTLSDSNECQNLCTSSSQLNGNSQKTKEQMELDSDKLLDPILDGSSKEYITKHDVHMYSDQDRDPEEPGDAEPAYESDSLDIQQLIIDEEELHPQLHGGCSSLELEDPLPPHIKEERKHPQLPNVKEEEDPQLPYVKVEEEDPQHPQPPLIKEGEIDPKLPNIKEAQKHPQPPHIKEEEEDSQLPHVKEEEEDFGVSKLPLTDGSVKSKEEKPLEGSELHHHCLSEDHCGGPPPDNLMAPLSDSDKVPLTRDIDCKDIQQLISDEEKLPPQLHEGCSSLEHEDPLPPHIKEEQKHPQLPHIKEEEDSQLSDIKKEEEDPQLPYVKVEEEPPHIKEEQKHPQPAHIHEEEEDPQLPHIKEEEEEFDVSKLPLTGGSVKSIEEKPPEGSELHHHCLSEDHCGGPPPDNLIAPLSDSDKVPLTRDKDCKDIQQLISDEEELPPQLHGGCCSLEHEDPLPPHIKEEQKQLPHVKEEEDPQHPQPPHIKEEEIDPKLPNIKEAQKHPQPPNIQEEEEDPQLPHVKEEEEEFGVSKLPLTGGSVKSREEKPPEGSELHHHSPSEDHCGGPPPDNLMASLSDSDKVHLTRDKDCKGFIMATRSCRRKPPLQDAKEHAVKALDKTEELEVQFMNSLKGRGVFAKAFFRKGDFVVEYRGELINSVRIEKEKDDLSQSKCCLHV